MTIEAQRPSTAVEVLTRVIERDDSAVSATTARRQEHDPVPLLRKACARIPRRAHRRRPNPSSAHRASPRSPRRRKRPSPASATGRHGQPCTPSSSGSCSTVTSRARCCGTRRCSSARDHSRDLAAVLANRLEVRDRGSGPLPWLPPVPRQLAEDDFWRRYFDRRAELIERYGAAVRAGASTWTEQTAPAWAVSTLNEPDLTRDLAIWRAAHDVADSDLRPTGPPAYGVKDSYQQHRLDRRVGDAGAMPAKADARIAQLGEPSTPASPPTRTGRPWPGSSTSPTARACAPPTCAASPPPAAADRQPAAALAYRVIDAIGDHTPSTSTTQATARSTAGKDAPPAPTIRRPYEPPPLPRRRRSPTTRASSDRSRDPAPAADTVAVLRGDVCGVPPCQNFVNRGFGRPPRSRHPAGIDRQTPPAPSADESSLELPPPFAGARAVA